MKIASAFTVEPRPGEILTVHLSVMASASWRDQEEKIAWLKALAMKLEAEFRNGERTFP